MAHRPELHLDDNVLIRNVLNTLNHPCKNQLFGNFLWSQVGEVFGLGSTSAHKLCERFGFDPNVKVRKVFRGRN